MKRCNTLLALCALFFTLAAHGAEQSGLEDVATQLLSSEHVEEVKPGAKIVHGP